MNPRTKDVTVGKGSYRVSKLDALTAVWILNLLVAESAKQSISSSTAPDSASREVSPLESLSVEDQSRSIVATMWLIAGSPLEEGTYRKIQNLCLRAVTTSTGEPVFDGSRWALKELADDPPTVNKLILEVLQFNLAPFFPGDSESKTAEPQPPSKIQLAGSR